MGGLGEALGTILASKKGPKRAKSIFSIKLRFLMALGKRFGKVLGGFGEGFGKVLAGSGSLLDALGTSQCSILCFRCFCSVLMFLGLFLGCFCCFLLILAVFFTWAVC